MGHVQTGNFITWLKGQFQRDDDIGALARALRVDPRSNGLKSVDDLSKRLNQQEAPWEFHDALDAAKTEWQAEGTH